MKRRNLMLGGGAAVTAALIGSALMPNPQTLLGRMRYRRELRSWYAALDRSRVERASVACIGDSITQGHGSTNWDTRSWVAVLRSMLQARYGDGGEGFLSLLHTDYTGNTDLGIYRWTYSGVWTQETYGNSRVGEGAIAGRRYAVTIGDYVEIVINGTGFQVMTGTNHNVGGNLEVLVDGVLNTTYSMRGDGVLENFTFGQLVTVTGLSNGSHTVRLRLADEPLTTPTDAIFIEGIRGLKGTTGVVVDRFGKGFLRADWLGQINESDQSLPYFQSLKNCVDRLDTDLFIVTLGINDYIGQVALATFETRLTTIATRCKAVADTVILACPQPNSAFAIPYSSYVASMRTVAAALGCHFVDMYSRWGGVFQTAMMTDANHPNDIGHNDMAKAVYDEIT